MSRLDHKMRDDLSEDYQYLLSEDAMGEINLLCVMANNPDTLQAYMRYGSTLWADSGLNGADVERVILAVGRKLDAAYEWHQHVPIGRDEGVSEDELAAISENRLDDLEDRTAAITAYAQAVATDDVGDATFEAAAAVLDDRTVVGVTLLAAHYLATQRFLSALEIPLEDGEEFIGWSVDT